MHPLETELLTKLLDSQSEILQRLTAMETYMHELMGNGQPGRIRTLENKVQGLVRLKHTFIGWVSAAGAIGGVIGSTAFFVVNLLNFWHSHKGK